VNKVKYEYGGNNKIGSQNERIKIALKLQRGHPQWTKMDSFGQFGFWFRFAEMQK